MKSFAYLFLLLLTFVSSSPVASQEATQHPDSSSSMQGMHHDHGEMRSSTFIDEIVHHANSGTSVEPDSTVHTMLMTSKANWDLMFHAEAFFNVLQQSGPRGD